MKENVIPWEKIIGEIKYVRDFGGQRIEVKVIGFHVYKGWADII